jgi:hypothetical protein
LNTLTKPLQVGAQIAKGVVGQATQAVQGLLGGGKPDEPPRPEQEKQPEKPQGPPPRQRRNTKPKPLGDATITSKVESELFREPRVDKGKIDVNTVDGVVYLRGEARTPEQIKDLEAKTAKIPEVKGVENLLHLPKTPAPTRADTPAAQQRTRKTKAAPAKRRAAKPRTTSERKSSQPNAEPTPKETAATGTGRQPAPLGSNGDSGSGSGSGPGTGSTGS